MSYARTCHRGRGYVVRNQFVGRDAVWAEYIFILREYHHIPPLYPPPPKQ